MRTFDEFILEMRSLLDNPETRFVDIAGAWQSWGDDEAWLFGLTDFECSIYMDIGNLIFAQFGMPCAGVG